MWTNLVLSLGEPIGLGLFLHRIGGPYLDQIFEGLVLDPNGVNCGFDSVLEFRSTTGAFIGSVRHLR